MWLIIVLACALIVTALHFTLKERERYKLGFLALMLWGTFIMVLVDHTLAFMEHGGDFIEMTTDGLVPDSTILGVLMVLPLLAIGWFAACTKIGARIGVDSAA
jgi:hypothetical protein